MADDELDLSTLPDDELVEQMHDDLYDGLKEEIEDGVKILLERGWAPYDVLTKALVEGMRIVGIDFRDGILFVPLLISSASPSYRSLCICSTSSSSESVFRSSSSSDIGHSR